MTSDVILNNHDDICQLVYKDDELVKEQFIFEYFIQNLLII